MRKRPNINDTEMQQETLFSTKQNKPNLVLSTSPKTTTKPNCIDNAWCYFCNFCESTSIHGFKFLGERHRYIIEKIWWLCVVSFAFTGSGSLIYKAYAKWQGAPVIVTFATTETPIWKIPFPAVTICPQTKANPSLFNYTAAYLKLRNNTITENERQSYDLFSLVCDGETEYIDPNRTKTIDVIDIFELLLSFNGVQATNCKWLGHAYNCLEILSFTLTNQGWCATFNMLDHDEVYVNSLEFIENKQQQSSTAQKWSIETGYPTDDMDVYPRRTMLSGTKAGLHLDLMAKDSELDYVCSDLQGFKVALHHPSESPNMDQYFLVPLDQAVLANIRPRMITTADDIRGYAISDRQCYLPGEKTLESFVSYTQSNCMAECLRNYTTALCGCIGFDMPGHNDSNICGAGSRECMNLVKVHMLELEREIKKVFTEHRNELCNCLPACTEIDYDVETSQTTWNWKRTYQFKNFDFAKDFNAKTDHMSRLVVYYSDLQFLTTERHEFTGIIDFLSSSGGLLGLFCGFSVTSAMEILYYLTLRLVCNIKKFGKRVWSGDKELLENSTR